MWRGCPGAVVPRLRMERETDRGERLSRYSLAAVSIARWLCWLSRSLPWAEPPFRSRPGELTSQEAEATARGPASILTRYPWGRGDGAWPAVTCWGMGMPWGSRGCVLPQPWSSASPGGAGDSVTKQGLQGSCGTGVCRCPRMEGEGLLFLPSPQGVPSLPFPPHQPQACSWLLHPPPVLPAPQLRSAPHTAVLAIALAPLASGAQSQACCAAWLNVPAAGACPRMGPQGRLAGHPGSCGQRWC